MRWSSSQSTLFSGLRALRRQHLRTKWRRVETGWFQLCSLPARTTSKPMSAPLKVSWFSTMTEVSHGPAPGNDYPSFIKASLDELEGPYHCWLNRFAKNERLYVGDRIFLVLSARTFDHVILFENIKKIKKRFPHLFIMGLIHSSADTIPLIWLLMAENISFPILLSKKTFPETEKGACYLLFKNFESPVVYHEKDVDLEILFQAIQKLHVLPAGNSKSVSQLSFPSWKQDGITKEHYMCSSLQNLLLNYPGCISADESGNRLFISDCNHHRIIVSDGNGVILDCIGSSPGFEDGDFEFAKLSRPAGSYYHAAEDCLYFVDSENHAIRKADLEARSVHTLYPTSASNKSNGRIWSWIMNNLGLDSTVDSNVEETSDVFDSKTPYLPWHMLKSVDDILFILDRRFQTVWIMDLTSAKIDNILEGSPEILETCRKQIAKKLSLLDCLAYDWFQQQIEYTCSAEGLPHSGLLSSLTTLQNQVFICDTVGHRILKVDQESGVCSNFQFSNFGILGLPYWMTFPLETFYATRNGLSDVQIDHLQSFQLLPGRIHIQVIVDVPQDAELVQPLFEACIWRQARGAATEISVIEDVPGSVDKVGVAQQWYDELDDLASPKPKSEQAVPDDNLNNNLMVEDKKNCVSCNVNTSPGTSEVIVYTVLYLKLKRDPDSQEENPKVHAGRILDIMSSGRNVKMERDLWSEFLSKSKGDLRDLVFMKPLHIRIKLESFDHPKADNERDIILTDSSIQVKVSLN
ncbi:hypothetical protein QN277_028817 [Acacia crassicarpa]|uniref:NHL repeat-containing protein 2 n=2 Tax=Acacia crassicarpa TaxID=499986 RepID=A0AAE1J409_9FABA|nr:hypothetical protein QN277_028817 [Acacia crassicarpa]